MDRTDLCNVWCRFIVADSICLHLGIIYISLVVLGRSYRLTFVDQTDIDRYWSHWSIWSLPLDRCWSVLSSSQLCSYLFSLIGRNLYITIYIGRTKYRITIDRSDIVYTKRDPFVPLWIAADPICLLLSFIHHVHYPFTILHSFLLQSILYLQSNFNWFNTSLTFLAATSSMIFDWLPNLSTTVTQAEAEAATARATASLISCIEKCANLAELGSRILTAELTWHKKKQTRHMSASL